MVIEGDRAAVFWKFQGTQQGPFLGLTGTGQRLVLPMVSLCRFKADGIAYARYIYDFSGLLLKTGVLKAKPGQSPRQMELSATLRPIGAARRVYS